MSFSLKPTDIFPSPGLVMITVWRLSEAGTIHTPWEPVALVGFMVFFVEKTHKNHDYWASLRSLQGKKSP
jgi:hypothetical protein